MLPTTLTPTRRQAGATCLYAAVTFAVGAALVAAAMLAHAPGAAVPFVVLVGIGCPVAAVLQVPVALTVLRGARSTAREHHRHIAMFRQHLARLPETDHPLER